MAVVAKNERQRALVALTGFCGLRVSEALSITPESFDFDNMTLLVRGKGDKSRVVPVSNQAWAIMLKAVIQARLISPIQPVVDYRDRFAREILTSLGERAHLKRHIASHDMRHTFGTEILNAGADIRTAQELLGHASVTTTQIYTGVSLDNMRKAVDF